MSLSEAPYRLYDILSIDDGQSDDGGMVTNKLLIEMLKDKDYASSMYTNISKKGKPRSSS